MQNLRLVIDTNVLVAIIPTRSKHHWLFEAIRNNALTLLLSTEIIFEYEEQLGLRYRIDVTTQLLQLFLLKKNTHLIQPHFFWNLVTTDNDDNKFVDCAIAGNADFLITNDRDFDVVKRVPFPKVNIVTLEEFTAIWQSDSGKTV